MALRAAAYGGGNHAAKVLEGANLLCSSIGLPEDTAGRTDGDANGIRLGTQELTRWGLTPDDMGAVASLFARVLRGDDPVAVRTEVVAFRRQLADVHFVSRRA